MAKPQKQPLCTKEKPVRRKFRLRVFVDGKLQGGLCLRVTWYWLCCQATTALMLGCCLILRGVPFSPGEWLQRICVEYGQAFLASTLVLPLLLIDCLVFSNRVAGPIYRLRKAMRQLADSGSAPRMQFRSADLWQDLASEFNRVTERLTACENRNAELEARLAETRTADAESEMAEIA